MSSIDMVIPTLTKGYFTWNDQNNSLEFVSHNASADQKNKKRRGKNTSNFGDFPNFGRKKDESMPFSMPYSAGGGLASSIGGRKTVITHGGSSKFPSPIKYSTGGAVHLMDVKRVALDHLISDMEAIRDVSMSFKHLKNTTEFDHFLVSLLQYFTCFIDQLEQELRPHKTSFLEPSKAELQALADTRKKMEITRRKLGQSYCVLILGLGIEKQHHMGCGKKRVSSTHRDKKMFEDLYLFCTYVVWVTFRRKELERIKIEVGNMLRSEVFNPALQQKHKASVTAEAKKNNPEKNMNEISKTEIILPDQKRGGPKPIAERVHDLLNAKLPAMERLTPAQHRRKTGKRPAIRTAIYQRSTALVSLLPLPKEEPQYLFQTNKKNFKEAFQENENTDFTMSDIMTQKIGIIGEQMDLFNMNNLMPKSQENEDDNDSADDGNAHDRDSLMQSNHNMGRQTDAISRVTTAEEK